MELSERMLNDGMYPGIVEEWANEASNIQTEREAWKEAFTATRAYYSNNNGENSTRYREAIKQLKEMKLIR